ncbi:hypothetical protein J4760_08150 [Salinicoccus sp. ID82-1]|uniref:hypothetical protein n=1 Tax=Salinicoccus sp. ID82-1 TaxID=2820269 RepID=UPI001F4115CE|nr:hypothetical protein [Salinicoccus sp. ID82-1]MCG1009989.1 hypothetical protein [Salinicoccus sp. ID82-1]
MKILIAGGIYIDQKAGTVPFIGGHEVAKLIGSHSRHTVHLHTNFSTEATQQTKVLKRSLRTYGVDPRIAGRVSASYGTIDGDTVVPGSNVFETASSNRLDKLQDIDLLVLTTDISERDFRLLLNHARRGAVPVIVFTCSEYASYSTTGIDNYVLTDSGVPEYHAHMKEISEILEAQGIIESTPVARTRRESVRPPYHAVLRVLTQLVAISALLALLTFGILYALGLTGNDETYDTYIDPDQAVDHADCSTIGECRELGDDHLEALRTYIDIDDAPHLFVENRTQTEYITYTVRDFALTDAEVHTPLPVGSEEEYAEIWDRITTFFPNEYIDTINRFELFSDGEGSTLAFVDITEAGVTFAMDIRDNQDRPSEYRTLIHEFAHVYSLPIEDFNHDDTELEYLKEDTLMADFIDRFWSQYGEAWIENKYKSDPERQAFYNNNVNDFFEPYQATNPKEDFAITFVEFVTSRMPESGSQLKNVKVRSLYEDPELVRLRVDILSNILEYEKERALNEAQGKS